MPLSKAAAKLIKAQLGEDEKRTVVFPSGEGTPFTGFGKSKADLDKAVLEAMQKAAKELGRDSETADRIASWPLHDLRRSAKTLMQRAGVRPDVSERVLGHALVGVERTYDRHDYEVAKRDALERLAALVEKIVHPSVDNLVSIGEKTKKESKTKDAPAAGVIA